jgi:hypothetical protein
VIATWHSLLIHLGLRKKSYQSIFGKEGAIGSEAIRDLAKFCYAAKSTAVPNEHLSMVLQGRREVWLRIAEHLNLQPEELASLYGAVTVDRPGDE